MTAIRMLYKTFLALAMLLPVSVLAQHNEVGNWIMYFGMNKVSDKFSVHTEIQYRNHTISPTNIEQLLLRTGLNYHFTDNAFVTAGYAYILSYDYDTEQKDPEAKEHRIWQQFIVTDNVGRVKLEHRYRIEQRWVNEDYSGRLRYRLMLFVPLNKPKIEEGTFFLGLYDEIFLNTQKPFFDRNRAYAALGYQFHRTTGIQVGMLHQQLSDFGKWYLQFALVFNPDLTKQKRTE